MKSDRLLTDSSGWTGFFVDGPLATEYARHVKDPSKRCSRHKAFNEAVFLFMKRR
jgi:hypothetical protein